MLSFLYHLTHQFELEHGYRPNLLYLNPEHYEYLRLDLAAIEGMDELVHFLGMELILTPEVTHPQVVWSSTGGQNAVAI